MHLAKPATFVTAAVLLVTGCDTARPVPGTDANECARCHGFPPGAPHAQISNAQPSDCGACHTPVATDGTIVPGDTHTDGTPDIGHPSGFSTPSAHGYAAERMIASCTSCHLDYAYCTSCHAAAGFADWQTNCTFCHGTKTPGYTAADLVKAAPPEGVHGETLTTQPEVGAHQKHLLGGGVLSDGVACGECHTVPSGLSHLDGTATVTFGTLAKQGSPEAQHAGGTCTSTYCHGATLNGGASTAPSWTGSVACGDCHANPPLTGRHDRHVRQLGFACATCHADVAASTGVGIANTATARELHVDGKNDVRLIGAGTWNEAASTCSGVSCHTDTRSW